ncbi:MAG: glycosyltransferase family 39 protein [Acidimicrobiia bacterium]
MGVVVADAAEATPPTSRPALSDVLERLDDRLRGRLPALVVIVATAVGWVVRFDQDDGFITYRYARNLSRGLGLVFNPGQRVQGYTSFLWAVVNAIPERFGWAPTTFGVWIGLPLLALSLFLTYRLSARFLARRGQQLLALVILAVNMTFLAYGTGGMETMLQTTLVLAVAVLLVPSNAQRQAGVGAWAAAGFLAGLALLTRLDSVLLVGSWFALALWAWIRRPGAERRLDAATLARVGAGGLAAAVLVVPWLVWTNDYYGSILPNTLAAKSGFSPVWRVGYGLLYLIAFFLSYGVFLLVPRLRDGWRRRATLTTLVPLAVVTGVWFAYVLWAGADFMEFRFVVPVIPYLAILGVVVIDPITRHTRALLVTLVVVSALHRVVPTPPVPILSIYSLRGEIGSHAQLGRELHRWFARASPADEPVIAVSPLGAISYYSDLPVVDMIGLVDPGIAKHAPKVRLYYPGHLQMASIPQLTSRHVSLVFGTLWPLDRVDRRKSYNIRELTPVYPVVDLGELPTAARVIEIPDGRDRVFAAIQMKPDRRVDEVVRTQGLRTFPLDRSCRGSAPQSLGTRWVTFALGTRTCK